MNSLSHIAIIMDGNGRWAIKKKKSRKYGHLEGVKNIKKLIPYFLKEKIKYLTLFAFSHDNWKRPRSEVSYLFFLFKDFLKKNLNYLMENDVQIKFIGIKKKLPKVIISLIKKIEKITENKKKLTLVIAFNYSAKQELIKAVKSIVKNKKKIINEKTISNNLYTSHIPDPDILIRTGFLTRISNFMLWQIAYSEIFFINKYWPDFNITDLKKIILKFKKTKRNFGSI